MTRPVEYPLAVPGYSKVESGRAYVTARFALDLLKALTPYWDSAFDAYRGNLVNIAADYCRAVSHVDLTAVFCEADREYFSPNTHYSYLANEGQLRAKLIGGVAYNLASVYYMRELWDAEALHGVDIVQRWFTAASNCVCKSTFRLSLANMTTVILKPRRPGAPPTAKRVQQVLVNLTFITR